jgi:hypothetical protein
MLHLNLLDRLQVKWDAAAPWLPAKRRRLRQMQAQALMQRVAHHRAAGEYRADLRLARRASRLRPLAGNGSRWLCG